MFKTGLVYDGKLWKRNTWVGLDKHLFDIFYFELKKWSRYGKKTRTSYGYKLFSLIWYFYVNYMSENSIDIRFVFFFFLIFKTILLSIGFKYFSMVKFKYIFISPKLVTHKFSTGLS